MKRTIFVTKIFESCLQQVMIFVFFGGCLMSLSLSLCLSSSFFLSLSISFFLSLSLSISLSLSLSLCLYISFFLSFPLFLSLSLCLSISFFLSLSLALSIFFSPLTAYLWTFSSLLTLDEQKYVIVPQLQQPHDQFTER